MNERVNCPWCSSFNKVDGDNWPWCHGCCHRADVPKEQCDCLMCEKLPSVIPDVPDPNRTKYKVTLDVPDWTELPAVPDVPDLTALPDVPAIPERLEVGVEVLGRYFHDPHFTVHAQSSRIALCIGDNENADQWVQVFISEETIGRWFRAMCDADEEEPGEEGQFDEA